MHHCRKDNRHWMLSGLFTATLAWSGISLALEATGLNLTAGQPIDADSSIVVQLDQVPTAGEIRVFVGTKDFTVLFPITNKSLTFQKGIVELPRGENEIAVYQVTGSTWSKIGSFPIRVRKVNGFDRLEISPQLTLASKSQLREGHSVDAGDPIRATYTDFTGQGGIGFNLARDGLTMQLQSNIIATSYRNEALRFALLDTKAPKVDLSDYLLSIKKGDANLQIGHFQYQGSRYIMPLASSRGISTSYQLNRRVSFAATAQNTNELVGYNNIFGISQRDNRVFGATIRTELLPRPGALKLEGFVSHGTQLSNPGFNTGEISDAEQSQGGSIRLSATTAEAKISADIEAAYSSFTNVSDPGLQQGDSIVPVEKTTDSAFFTHMVFNAYNGQLVSGKPLSSVVALEYERVDPLFKTVGIPSGIFQADSVRYQLTLDNTIGDALITAFAENKHDNLDNLATVLTTQTRTQKINIALPLKSLLTVSNEDQPASPWLPNLNMAYVRIHQFGSNRPDLDPLSGFTPDQIPNQLTSTIEASATWEGQIWSIAYSHNRSTLDNRQPGRENADSNNIFNGLNGQLQLTDQLSVNAGINRNTAEDQELAFTSYTDSQNVGVNWALSENWSLSGTVETSHTSDSQQNSDNRTLAASAQVAWQFLLPSSGSVKNPGQAFLRYDRQANKTTDNPSALQIDISNWAILAGISINLF